MYKKFDSDDRVAIFKHVLDLDVPETKKSKILNQLYEEYRLSYEMYTDVHEFIDGIELEDLHLQ